MITVNLIVMGKMSEKFYSDAMKEYIKRLSAYCKFNVVEIPEVRVANEDREAEIAAALSKEAELIAKHLTKGAIISMCVEGKQYSSEKFARLISDIAAGGESQINFVIGSSHGLSEDIKKMSRVRLSVSEMTLPHQLCRVVLTEQIYRSFKINSGERYHK